MAGIILTLAESLYPYVYTLEFTSWVGFLGGWGKKGVLFPLLCDGVSLNCIIEFKGEEKKIKKRDKKFWIRNKEAFYTRKIS